MRCALLEDCPSQRIDVIAAMIAGISCAASHAVVLALFSAFVAHRPTIRPTCEKDVHKAGIIGWELCVKVLNRVLLTLQDAVDLFAFRHNNYSMPSILLVVKG